MLAETVVAGAFVTRRSLVKSQRNSEVELLRSKALAFGVATFKKQACIYAEECVNKKRYLSTG